MSNDPTDIDTEDFEWGVRTDGGTTASGDGGLALFWTDGLPRVTPRRVAALGLAAGLLLATTLAFTGGASANTTFTATNVDVTSNGGTLNSLVVAPAGNISYDGFDREAEKVVVTVRLKEPDGNWTTVGTMTKQQPSGQQGTVQYDFAQLDVIKSTAWKKVDFRARQDGSDATTTMAVEVTATFVNATNGGENVTSSASDSFTVNVTNEAAGAGVGGSANTGGT